MPNDTMAGRMPGKGKRLFAIGGQGSDPIEIGDSAHEGVTFFTVSDHNIFDRSGHIVAKDLPKNAAVEIFGHGLTFDQHPGMGGFVEDEQVEALGQLAQFDFPFHGDIGGGIILYLEQVLDEVLTHPLLWGEAYPLAAQVIPDFLLVLFRLTKLKWMGRIVDFNHGLKLFVKFTNNEDKRRNRW